MIIEFEALFEPYAQAAVTRLGYLYPTARFFVRDLAVVVEGEAGDDAQIRRDVLYQLYREKIYADGLPTRSMMYKALLS